MPAFRLFAFLACASVVHCHRASSRKEQISTNHSSGGLRRGSAVAESLKENSTVPSVQLVEQQAQNTAQSHSVGAVAAHTQAAGQARHQKFAPPGLPMDDEASGTGAGYADGYGPEYGWPNEENSYHYVDDPDAKNRGLKDLLFDIGGGTGASVGGPGDVGVDRALLRRMRSQDKTVMLLLLMAYLGSLLFSASLAYRTACNDSPVKYYADPRLYNMATTDEDAETFLEIFNQPPKDAQLQVTGLLPIPALPEYVVDNAVNWLGARYRVAFSFALDLSPWVVRNQGPNDSVSDGAATGVAPEDLERLRMFLSGNANDLAYLEVQKTVDWKDWEELATNIKTRIRQEGFRGVIHVHRSCEERVPVHKNKPWANFMHSRTTKVLLALSVLGYFLYTPYMYIRHRATTVLCRYRVDVGIDTYWPLIAGKIGPTGFDENAEDSTRTEARSSL